MKKSKLFVAIGLVALCVSIAVPSLVTSSSRQPQEGQEQAEALALVPICEAPGVGKVEADLATMQLKFTCYKPGVVPLEYSILAGNVYKQSEAGGWALPSYFPPIKYETLPHYVTFIVTAGRYENICSAICRENDKRLGCNVF